MSIPSSSQPPSGNPEIPPLTTPGATPTAAGGQQQQQQYQNYMDPAGIWLRFFQQIMPGQTISAKEVQMFQIGVMKTMGQIIAHENDRWKETMRKMRQAEEGND